MTGEGSYPPGDLEAHQARSALRTPVGRVRPVLTVVPGADHGADDPGQGGGRSVIDELVREGARRMLAEALQAEVDAYIARHIGERGPDGRRLVVRRRHVRQRQTRRTTRRGPPTGSRLKNLHPQVLMR